MPGIVGLVTRAPRARAESELARMLAAIVHEPFYSTGTWADETLGVYVGWVVRQESKTGKPFGNEQGDVTLVWSGEEFPEPGTRQRLEQQGHAVQNDGPSYLVHLYEEDPSFPADLNGVFHGIVADRRRGTVTLFNDRFGMHRLYYHEGADAFYFFSEVKAILAAHPQLRQADLRGLGELVSCGCVLDNRTVFQNVNVLPGGSSWVFRNGALDRRNSYFQPAEWEQQERLDPESYFAAIKESLSRNLPRYFNGSAPIGLALTGGLDTRVILALRPPARRSLPCYTFGSEYRDTQDVKVARRVSEVCEQPHHVLVAGKEFLGRFAQYAERAVYLTDGCANISHAPDLYVSEKARAIAPVKIVGTYGSEVLTLAPAFKPRPPAPGLFAQELLDSTRVAESRYADLRREHPLTFAAFRQSPWWHHGILALEETQLSVRSPYLDNDFIKTVYRAPQAAADVRLRLIADRSPALAALKTDRGVGGGPVSSGISKAYQEFTYKAEYAYDYGMPHALARADRRLSALGLERLFLGRHKAFHFRRWYRRELSQYVREMLLDARTLSRPYLQRRGVEAMVAAHVSGDGNYTTELHKVLGLELLHRLFFDAR